MNSFELEHQLRNNCENHGITIKIIKCDFSREIGYHRLPYLCVVRLQHKHLQMDYESNHSSIENACNEAMTKALKCFESV